MKIIMFGHKEMPSREGGIEVVVQELSTRMAKQGHQILCFNRIHRHTIKRKEYDGVRLCYAPTVQGKGLTAVTSSFFAAVCSVFRRCDIVHIHGEGPAFFCFLPKLAGKTVIVTIHGLDWAREKWQGGFASRFIHWGEQMAVHFADEIIVLSSSAGCYFLQNYQRKTVRIPNGRERAEHLSPHEIQRCFGLEKDSYLLFLGRLVPEKGIHHLIEAFRGVQTEKKLVIAGKSSDSDEYVQHLYEMARDDKRILFTGFAEGELLRELYSNCYLYTLPSSLEGMPLTLLEALSYGNCCVLSDLPECREVAGDSGLYVPVGNVSEMRNVLQELCDDRIVVEKFRCRAQQRSEELESWDEVTTQTLKLYETAIARRVRHENSPDQ